MSGALYGGLFLIVILLASLVFVQQENFTTCGVIVKPSNYYWDPLTGFAKYNDNKRALTAAVRAQQQVSSAIKQGVKRIAENESIVEQQTLKGRTQAIHDIPQSIEDYEFNK